MAGGGRAGGGGGAPPAPPATQGGGGGEGRKSGQENGEAMASVGVGLTAQLGWCVKASALEAVGRGFTDM